MELCYKNIMFALHNYFFLDMKFVDRTEEIERLNRVLTLSNPSFTAIYGRRRLGKSTLIKKVINPEKIISLSY